MLPSVYTVGSLRHVQCKDRTHPVVTGMGYASLQKTDTSQKPFWLFFQYFSA